MSRPDGDAGGAPLQLPLRQLSLRPGMALQTQRMTEGAAVQEAQYFGAIEGKGVMVGALGPQGIRMDLAPGESCLVRGFTGQYEFSFAAQVLQNFEKPFAYTLLAYPAQATARLVRRSARSPANWPATLTPVPGPDTPAGPAVAGTVVDLSMAGAMVRAAGSPGIVGAPVNLKLSVTIEQAPAEVYLSASICHNNRAPGEDAFFIGMAFRDLTTQDTLVLSYLTRNPQP